VYFLVSICTEAFERLMRMRALYRQLGIDSSVSRDAPELLRGVRRSFGGRLVLLDWSAGRVLAHVSIAGVSGVARQDRSVIACSWIDQCVYKLRGRAKLTTTTHPWFNYLHSVDLTGSDTYLLASAGSDLIVEITPAGEVVWAWFGPDHGYATLPDGTAAFFDPAADYRPLRRATSEQAMHVTSAIRSSPETVLATLFHQGQLIAIDRSTGESTVKLGGLSKPHGIHRRDGGFILSDTLGHRILLLDHELTVCSEMSHGAQWLQDTIVTSAGTYLALENVHIDHLPATGLTNSMVEIDGHGRSLRRVEFEADYRLFSACEIDGGLALELQHAWDRTGNFNGLRGDLVVDWRDSMAD
jgi:hypothetical protein